MSSVVVNVDIVGYRKTNQQVTFCCELFYSVIPWEHLELFQLILILSAALVVKKYQ